MMNDPRSPLRRIVALAALVVVALAMAACTKKINSVDASYTTPEGRTSAVAQQIAFRDLPAMVSKYKMAPATCDTCLDSLDSVTPTYATGPGVINGMIFDGTAASTYQVLRRESNGGYAPLFDYVLNPLERFAQSGWKLFTWLDKHPSGFDPPSYLGRGIVSGVITTSAPLTNVSLVHGGDVQDITLSAADSLQGSIHYTPVPDAVAYVVQIYLVPGHLSDAYIHNAAPAPFATQDHLDYYVAWCPATLGIIDNSRVKILNQRTLIPSTEYAMRMAAVDEQGRLVGFSYGEVVKVSGPEVGYYRMVQRGSFQQKTAARPANGAFTFSTAAAPARSRSASSGTVGIGGR
jgi:hypothetical protein